MPNFHRRVTTHDRHPARMTAIVVAYLILACSPGPLSAQAGSPDGLAFLLQWGEEALEQNRFSEAEARFRNVLAIDWNHPQAYSLLQETRRRRDDTLRQWRYYARTAGEKGQWTESLHWYDQIIRESPQDTHAAHARAQAQRHEQAAFHIRAGLERFLLDDYQGAQLEFEQALLLVPDDSIAITGRDRAGQRAGQTTGLDDLRADPDTWTQYLDALKRFRAGDLAGAERIWNAVLTRYPGNEAVRSNLEQINRRRKQVADTGDDEIAP